jgi:hypothetical protein
MKNNISFLFSLYESTTGERIVTHSVSGSKMAPVLKEIAKIVKKHKKELGENNVILKTLKVRLPENKIVMDPKKMDSLNALLEMTIQHYGQSDATLVVESSSPKKKSIIENLKKVLSDPKKSKKLVKELELPSLDKGDILLVGKFKNRKAEITGFETDENGQPVAKTTKGDQKILKPRVAKLIPTSK